MCCTNEITRIMKKYKSSKSGYSTAQEPAVAYRSMHNSFKSIINISPDNNHKYLHIIKDGVGASALQDFMDISQIHIDLMAEILHLNSRTLRRIQENDILNTLISEKLVELIRLYKLGHEVYGDIKVFNEWMNTKIKGIGYLRPLDIIDTSIGIDIVTDELNRLIYGVYA